MSSNSTVASPSFVPQPTGRGTIGLLWSCALTISLCVWSAIHLNVLRPDTGRFGAFWIKLMWATVAILSPEAVVSIAMDQMQEARLTKMERNKHIANYSTESGSTAAANNAEVDHSSSCPIPIYRKQQDKELWGREQGYFVGMGGITLTKHGERPRPVGFKGIVSLAKLDMLPDIPLALIKARTKTDGLSKILVCVQVSWMFIQTIARKPYGLPITLLELHTLTHVVAAIMLYIIWWYKPQGVAEPFVIDLGECQPCIQNVIDLGVQMAEEEKEMMATTYAPSTSSLFMLEPGMAFCLFGIINGEVHATAWNEHFPSLVEHQLWRVSSCVIGVTPLIVFLGIFAEKYIRSHLETNGSSVAWFLLVLFCSLRLFLVVESFISVRSLPIGAYDTIAWVTFLPHIG